MKFSWLINSGFIVCLKKVDDNESLLGQMHHESVSEQTQTSETVSWRCQRAACAKGKRFRLEPVIENVWVDLKEGAKVWNLLQLLEENTK